MWFFLIWTKPLNCKTVPPRKNGGCAFNIRKECKSPHKAERVYINTGGKWIRSEVIRVSVPARFSSAREKKLGTGENKRTMRSMVSERL